MLKKYYNKIINGGKEQRNVLAKKNIFFSFIIKGLNILIHMLLVPLTISFIGPVQYGIWLTISSFTNWFQFLDIGLGNGLRVRLNESFSKGHSISAKVYTSTTYALIGIIVVVLLVIFWISNPLISWNKIFNSEILTNDTFKSISFWVFTFFILRFLTDLIKFIVIADQKTSLTKLINFLSNIFIISIIFILYKTTEGSLFLLAFYSGLSPIIIGIVASIYLFKRYYKFIIPSFKRINFKLTGDLTGMGFKFFFIQLTAIILISTDNIIITQLMDPYEVTIYNIAHKYFYLAINVWSIIPTTLLPAFSDAYFKQDFNWIKKTAKWLKNAWIILSIIIVLMLFGAKAFYKVWVGSEFNIPFVLSLIMAFTVIIHSWNSIYMTLITGIGKLNLSLFLSLFTFLFNIPLSILFAKYFNLGSTGVILATAFCLCISGIFFPIQFYKLANQKATKIWNK